MNQVGSTRDSSSGSLTVYYSMSGSADSGIDYSWLNGYIEFADGQSAATITLHPYDDGDVEGDEFAQMTLSADSSYTLGSSQSASITIFDDDNPLTVVSVQASDSSASESGDPGEYQITRGSSLGSLTVHYSMSGDADEGSDYSWMNGYVQFADGQSTATVTLNPLDDSEVEGSETATLTLSADAAYTLGTNQSASISITDNDVPLQTVSVQASDSTASESGDTGEYRLTRDSSVGSLMVYYSMSGSATEGTDYSDFAGSLEFADGQTVATLTLNPFEDSDGEGPESAVLTLSFNENYTTGANQSASVTITDNDPIADPPIISAPASVSGNEDSTIALEASVVLADTDGSETLGDLVLSGVPDGAVLSAGTNNQDGTWTLAAGQLDGLTIAPPANSDSDFTITLTATATESANGDSAQSTKSITVQINAVADAPILSVQPATGMENESIPLTIAASLADTDGSEQLLVRISGVPTGATLSAGIDQGGGLWEVTAAELSGLSITPPLDDDTNFTLTVAAVSTEIANSGEASVSESLAVTVEPAVVVNQPPAITVPAALQLPEDSTSTITGLSISDPDAGTGELEVALSVAAGSLTLASVAGLSFSQGDDSPAAVLTFRGMLTDLNAALDGMTYTPNPDYSGSDQLSVDVDDLGNTGNGGALTATANVDIMVTPVADTPTITIPSTVTGNEDTAINLGAFVAFADADGSETLGNVTISGVPSGATLSAGTDNQDGTWTLAVDQLDGLTITPAFNSDSNFVLTLLATASETANGDTAQASETVNVELHAVADAPVLNVQDTSGYAGEAIPLSILGGLPDFDGSEDMSFQIAGVPNGTLLSAGIDQGNGTWVITPQELTGLNLTTPIHDDSDFVLTVTATSTESSNLDQANTVESLAVTVHTNIPNEAPEITVPAPIVTEEDTSVAINGITITDPDAVDGELEVTLSVATGTLTLADVSELSAVTGDGENLLTFSGTLTAVNNSLTSLEYQPTLNFSGQDTLSISVDDQGNTGSGGALIDTATLQIEVSSVLDVPNLTGPNSLTIDEDETFSLGVSAAWDTDGSEELQAILSGVPEGALLSAGIDNGDGTWTLTHTEFEGVTVTPPLHSHEDFTLTITATATETYTGESASTEHQLSVQVLSKVDDPAVSTNSTWGLEDAILPLQVAADLVDQDGSETIEIELAGLPVDATLSAGTDQGSGVWLLTSEELQGLTLTSGANTYGVFDLTLTATATDIESQETSQVVETFQVEVEAVADEPSLIVQPASGTEDTAIPVSITGSLADNDGSEQLTFLIRDVPIGATLSAGTYSSWEQAWVLAPEQLTNLTLTPASNFSGILSLEVEAVSRETSSGSSASVTEPFDVDVQAVNDTPKIIAPAEITVVPDQVQLFLMFRSLTPTILRATSRSRSTLAWGLERYQWERSPL